MNIACHNGPPHTGCCEQLSSETLAIVKRSAGLLFSIIVCSALSGCFSFLKPVESTERNFILNSVTAAGSGSTVSNSIGLGVGQIKLPTYLFDTSLVVRRGTNEIEYLPWAIWAERLDAGFQRVLVADLVSELRTDHVYASAWQKDAVSAEVYATVQQFDVNTAGEGVLIVRWRVLSPGGGKILKAGLSRFTRSGPSPDQDAAGSVSTLSVLAADFSRELAQVLRDTVAGGQ
jgi:uncharacterized lipoprotein YmbA